jgi:hypothetical protein
MFELSADDMNMCAVNEIPKQLGLKCKQCHVMEYKDNFEQLNETCLSDVQH